MKINYVPKVFAHRITEADLTNRPELALQNLKLEEVYILREITVGDIEDYGVPKEAEGQWILNSAFITDEALGEDDQFEISVKAKRDGSNIEFNLTFKKDEKKPSSIMLLGALSLAMDEVRSSMQPSRATQGELDIVNYTLTEMDIEIMGDMNPGHKVGDVIPLPRKSAEMLAHQSKMVALTREAGCDASCAEGECQNESCSNEANQ